MKNEFNVEMKVPLYYKTWLINGIWLPSSFKISLLKQKALTLLLVRVYSAAERGEQGGKLPQGLKVQWASYYPIFQGSRGIIK